MNKGIMRVLSKVLLLPETYSIRSADMFTYIWKQKEWCPLRIGWAKITSTESFAEHPPAKKDCPGYVPNIYSVVRL